jgi:HlyD family secretion protein
MSAPPRKTRKRLYIGAGGAVVVLGGAAGLAPLKGASADVDASRLATAERGTMVKSVVATGKVEPITKIEIKSKANGIIKVRMPTSIARSRLATSGGMDASSSPPRCAARRPTCWPPGPARRRRSAAEEEHRRGGRARGAVRSPRLRLGADALRPAPHPQSALDDAHSLVDVAENRKRAAQSQLAIGKAKVTEARAQVAQAKAAADRAAEDVANATIRAPIRGTVLSRDVEIGSPVSSILNLGANATLVMTLGDIEQVFVRGKVDEADIGHVRLGQPARIRVETFKDKVFNGKVTQISPMGVEKDNVTNFEVRVSIDNPGKELKANMTANAEIVLEEHLDALIVPEAAVTYDAQKNAFVEVAAPGTNRPEEGRRQARRRQRHEDSDSRRPQAGRQGHPAL